MTDEQIIKALECCATSESKCDECPYYPDACLTDDYENIFLKDVIDLINRTKGESNKYRNKYQAVKEEVSRLYDTVHCQKEEIARRKKQLMELKSEAIKEFAERLKTTIMNHVVYKNDCHNFSGNPEYLIRMVTVCGYITDLVEEMTEEESK